MCANLLCRNALQCMLHIPCATGFFWHELQCDCSDPQGPAVAGQRQAGTSVRHAACKYGEQAVTTALCEEAAVANRGMVQPAWASCWPHKSRGTVMVACHEGDLLNTNHQCAPLIVLHARVGERRANGTTSSTTS